jgi:DNA-binding GntR family transcriptional regulator
MPSHQGLMNAALARKQTEALELLRKHIQGTTDTVDAALKRMAAPVMLQASGRAA